MKQGRRLWSRLQPDQLPKLVRHTSDKVWLDQGLRFYLFLS